MSEVDAIFAMAAAAGALTFLDPHGFVHEVVTVRRAENLVVAGLSTTESTWYSGYAWQTAWCASRSAHVGRSFVATREEEPARFWGLRRDAIVEEAD